MVTHFDLTKEEDQREVKKYIRIYKPFIVLMGPPCIAMGGWSNINKLRNPSGHAQTYAIGRKIALLCIEVALMQVKEGRHFLVENPAGSKMFQFREWLEVFKASENVVDVNFPQCQTGLVHPVSKLPINKPTKFRVSHPILARPFVNLKCDCKKHDYMQGSMPGNKNVSKACQVWPRKLCGMIIGGIVLLKAENTHQIHGGPSDLLDNPC